MEWRRIHHLKCGDCQSGLDRIDLERILLKEEIKEIPGFISLLSGSSEIFLHAKFEDPKYPKIWGGFEVKLIDHSKEKDHSCKSCGQV